MTANVLGLAEVGDLEAKKLCCDIDVSHITLDVCYQNNLGDFFHLKVGNNIKGFEKILEHTGVD